jgi:hypothetical protein
MRSSLRILFTLLATLALVGLSTPANAQGRDPHIPVPVLPDIPLPSLPGVPGVPGLSDCKEAPTPDSPGQGISGFFAGVPDELPPEGDPFEEGSTTTIYEQYGYAGLRWRTYDLGCGPDAMRQPDAVIGTAVSNWLMQAPIALTALTGSVTEVAFQPTFLGAFDPIIEQVSTALHEDLFASWIPAVLALLGGAVIFMARRSALATTAAAVGWALIVVILATGLFRWPIAAGNAADSTVTGTLGAAVGRLDGHSSGTDPGMAVASHVEESILFRSWLAGTLGSADSETARKYGPDLFKAQALTWREAAIARKDPDAGKKIIEAKKKQWEKIAEKIKKDDPEAYEYLTGSRSDTRVGYAILSALGVFLALPFLLLSALLMLGCFIIVRLAVMLFPAFAVLGVFPTSRGLVTGLGRTVAAAIVNAIIFGIGAGVTIAVLGVLFHPGGGAPGWLGLVLMPLFSFIMWQALRPFRRLSTMVHPDADHFGDMSRPFSSGRRGGHWARKLAITGAAAASGGAAGAAVAAAMDDDDTPPAPPERAEARPSSHPPVREPLAIESAPSRRPGTQQGSTAPAPTGGPSTVTDPVGTPYEARHADRREPFHVVTGRQDERGASEEGFVPRPTSEGVPLPPIEPEWYDGEDVYPIYRPSADGADDVA